MNFVRVFSFLAFLIFSAQTYAIVTSQVDRKHLKQGETFVLVLNIIGSNATSIDLTPLEQGFEVLGRNHRSNTSVINGDLKRSTKLLITLAPKTSGVLEVPALTVAGEQSQPITINVSPVKFATAVEGGVELLSSLSGKTSLVQQPLIYQVNIVLGQRIYNAKYLEPKVKQGKALIRPLGEQREYIRPIKGRDVVVFEQSWVIIPQQSGVLEIEGAKLNATIQKKQTRVVPGSSASKSIQRIFLKADDYLLNVGPVPVTFSGADWITASELNLKTDLGSYEWKVGKPITRTITLNAVGTTQQQIAELKLPEVQGLKQYIAKPVFVQDVQEGTVRLQMILEVTLIPHLAGEVSLPEIRLPWWNTETNQEEVAVLPEQRFNVIKGEALADQQTPEAGLALKGSENIKSVEVKLSPVQMNDGVGTEQTESYEWDKAIWTIIGFTFVLGVMMVFYMRCKHSIYKTSQAVIPATKAFSMSDLKKACQKNDASAAREVLSAWAKQRFPESRQLNAVLAEVTPELRSAITELNWCCFSKESGEWSGEELFSLVEGFQPERTVGKKTGLVGLVPV